MILLYILIGVLIWIVFVKVLGGKIEDKEMTERGGIINIYSEYFQIFDENPFELSYEKFSFEEVKGASVRYQIFLPEYKAQVHFESNVIKGVMFTTYKIYSANNTGLVILYRSPKYNFTDAENRQLEMYQSIIGHALKDVLKEVRERN